MVELHDGVEAHVLLCPSIIERKTIKQIRKRGLHLIYRVNGALGEYHDAEDKCKEAVAQKCAKECTLANSIAQHQTNVVERGRREQMKRAKGVPTAEGPPE